MLREELNPSIHLVKILHVHTPPMVFTTAVTTDDSGNVKARSVGGCIDPYDICPPPFLWWHHQAVGLVQGGDL